MDEEPLHIDTGDQMKVKQVLDESVVKAVRTLHHTPLHCAAGCGLYWIGLCEMRCPIPPIPLG